MALALNVCERRRFNKLSISTENNIAQNTLWLHCSISHSRGKTKFPMFFKIIAFLVHNKNWNECIIIRLQVEQSIYLTASCNVTMPSSLHQNLQLFWNKNGQIRQWHKQNTACGLSHLGFRQYTWWIVDDKTNRLLCTTVVWQRKDLGYLLFGLRLRMHTLPIVFWNILWRKLATPMLQIARGKSRYTQWTIWSVKHIHCDSQISRFEPWIAIVGLSNPSQMRWPRETYVGTRRSVIHSSVTPFIVWLEVCVRSLSLFSFLQCKGKVVISSYADTTLWWVWGWLKQ